MTNVLFEDHTHAGFRPLAASQPTYELRCGLFNTRERVSMVAPGGGLLLAREVLRALHMAPDWTTEPSAVSDRSLWLNGRLAPSASLVAAMVGLRDQDWALWDERGLVAASVSPFLGGALLASWQKWEAKAWDRAEWRPTDILGELPAPAKLGTFEVMALNWIWEIVPATSAAIEGDLALLAEGAVFERHPFGIAPGPDSSWQKPGSLRRLAAPDLPAEVVLSGEGGLYLGSGGVELATGTQIDTTAGPVVLDSGVRVMAHTYLAGPLYVGRQTIIKPGTRIFGESSFGVGNRLAGEIGESTFGEFANKQHAGFIGHAVLGSWINLGALTTCSDLKNNYGEVRVNLGDGLCRTGQRFVGLLLGDHAKTAIGTMFNTGTAVGFASNIFGGVMPPKHVAAFSWGGGAEAPVYDSDRAQETAAVVMKRRGCRWLDGHARLFAFLHESTSG